MNKLQNIKKNIVSPIIRVVLYLRLSDEDRDKLTKDQLSESIKNQELMLRQYAKKQNWEVVGIYNDEDYSGGDRDRPNFNKMIKECERGNVDIVLVKSQSRFARDTELLEKYVHNLFHQWNVRFVTIIEGIDNTKRETKKTSQILGLTDQWYLEDTSLNIRKTLNSKREKGQFTGSFAKYGLEKDPENKNHLVPDSAVDYVVVRIYNEYFSGNSIKKIKDGLNKDKIPSPLEYKISKGIKLSVPFLKQHFNYEYIQKSGTYVVSVNFSNNQYQVLNNLITFNYLTTDMNKFNNKCSIKLKNFSSKKTKIYYSVKNNLEINKFDEKDFILLKENDEVPNNTTCIATITPELDRTHIIDYQFEITLKENKEQKKFYFFLKKYVDNIDVDLDFNISIRKKLLWSEQTVKSILTDEVYIGNLVQFKTTTISYKNHTIIKNSNDERIRKENTHKSIIDPCIWYAVQERLQKKSRSCKGGKIHAFSNKVFCMNCGRVFKKCGRNDEKGFGYLCCKDKVDRWANCNNNKYIREEDLHNLIIEKLNNMLTKFYDENQLNKLNDNAIEKDLFKEKIDNLEKEYKTINKELENKSLYFAKLYEDRTSGLLQEKEFIMLMNKYKDDSSKLEDRLKIIKKEIISTNAKKNQLKNKKTIFKKYRKIDVLGTDIINDFVDKVLIGYYDEKTNSRDIKVIWNFQI